MTRTIKIGISTCPNDTFAFHALMTGQVDTPGLRWEFDLLDVEQLNEGLFRGSFDVAKASFHAALHLSDRFGVFASGSALGYGNGPLLLASKAFARPWLATAPIADAEATLAWHVAERKPLFEIASSLREVPLPSSARTLCPGKYTTATFLFRTFFPHVPAPEQKVFSEIMPGLQERTADLGVCIHEGRFTWHEQDLACVADLGTLWHETTKMPLPLGGILGRLDLPRDVLSSVQSAIRRSIEYGLADRAQTLPTMRLHAQELADEVIWAHVDLYVNDATLDLGEEGERALDAMRLRAIDAAAIPRDRPSLKVLR